MSTSEVRTVIQTGQGTRVVVMRPGWLAKCFIFTAIAVIVALGLVVVVPLMLLGIVALLAIVLIAWGRAMIGGVFSGRFSLPSREGRENVTVIRRDEQGDRVQ